VLLRYGASGSTDHAIWTDHGLFRTPVPAAAEGLVLASPKRADLLSTSAASPHSELTVAEHGPAPFDGSPLPAWNRDAADPEGLLI